MKENTETEQKAVNLFASSFNVKGFERLIHLKKCGELFVKRYISYDVCENCHWFTPENKKIDLYKLNDLLLKRVEEIFVNEMTGICIFGD